MTFNSLPQPPRLTASVGRNETDMMQIQHNMNQELMILQLLRNNNNNIIPCWGLMNRRFTQ